MNNFSHFDTSTFSAVTSQSTSIFTNQEKKNCTKISKFISTDYSILASTYNGNAYNATQLNDEELFLNFGNLLVDLKQDPFDAGDRFQEILKNIIDQYKERSSLWSVETDAFLSLLGNELETWSLASSLFKDRIAHFDSGGSTRRTDLPFNIHRSESTLTNILYEEDGAVRQAQIVVDWLENCYRLRHDGENMPIKFQLDRTSTCENTLHLLKQNARTGGGCGVPSNIVKEIDADADLRTKKKMCDLDADDEQKLLTYIVFCIRAGMLHKACDACISVGQMWRAVTLEGWKLYHDANMENIQLNNQLEPTRGNKCRILWKKICWSMLKEPAISATEKVIYAILSGNLDYSISYFTSSWHDRLWAHFKIFVEQRVEMNLSTKFIPLQPQSSLPELYFNKSLTFDQIFTELESCSSEKIKIESNFRIYQIQKFLILGDISSLIDYMHSWCLESSSKPQPQFLRFMAHLILFLRSINVIEPNYEKSTVILSTFVELLISLNHRNLVAAYISYLPPNYQIILYAKFLENVKGSTERVTCIKLARTHNIEITKITKLIVENKIKDINFNINDDIDIASDITEFDNELIETIEWLLFEPLQRGEAILYVNIIFRYLLTANKLTGCFKLSKLFPSNSIPIILSNNSCKLTKDLPTFDQNNIRELICYKSYLDSLEAYEDWFNYFQKMRPTKIGAFIGSGFAEKVAHEQKLKQFDIDYKRWLNSANAKAQIAIEKLNFVLTFPEGRWLDDIHRSENNDVRTLQLSNLKQLCLPDACFRLHRVLHDTRMYKEAIRLADMVASERHQLYQVFSVENQERLMNIIGESSIKLLANKSDPLGYNII